MKKLFLLLLLASACNYHQEDPVMQRKILIKTDIDFAQMALEKGIREAFTYYAADEAVMMRDGSLPLFGKEEMVRDFVRHPRTGVTLSWVPVKADVSGDLGYTFGKWEMKFEGKDTICYGSYVTVWKKQNDGSWKFVLDGGNDTPKP